MNKTANYQLSQWEKADKVLMDDFNADNAKIDAALKAETDARTAAVTSLSSSRNCQAVTTGYTGTGVSGESNPNYLSFARRPFFIHVGGEAASGFSAVYGQTLTVCHSGSSTRNIHLTWSGNSVSWYEEFNSYAPSPTYQMNESGKQYKVLALLSV